MPPSAVIGLLSELLAKAGKAVPFVGGSVGFLVRGQGGGTWVLDLSEPGGRWTHHTDESAFLRCSTRIYTFAREFAALLLSPQSIPGLLETGFFVVEGDKAKLRRLGKLIQQGKGGSQVAVRSSTGD